ncbi:hypothetical protein C1752_01743 [Acaryochloris thomasi RCC1774]|uniref:Sulfotransferase n=1 Tax=Acaryochloris thomasi RCC1774 TaxID=1764569 RepID=A0A2W1JKT5_9CYAN|nr:sulfotransferase [Acaryochloris thomasi]PZD73806.1 hypothetical protein C1752_01743 [Acaryochloris thomasi RCC1774]
MQIAQNLAPKMNPASNQLKSPIFLLGSHKSGTSLLRSLLDSHSELFAAPMEMHFFKCMGYWVDYRLQRSWPHDLSIEEKYTALINSIESRNKNKNPYSDSVLPDACDLDLFRSCLESSNPKTNTELFIAYVNSLYYSLTGKTLDCNIRLVEKSVENAEYAPLLSHMFSDSKFIHIIRNPYSTIVALRKSKTKSCYPYLGGMAQSLHNSYYNLHKNQLFIKNYLVIRYEDLLTSTQEVMQQIADFLNIKFSESLIQPTLLGKPWGGNSSSNQAFQKISLSPLHTWKENITDLEIQLVNKMLLPAVQEFGYPTLSASRSLLMPAPQEPWFNYAKNRSFLRLMGQSALESS